MIEAAAAVADGLLINVVPFEYLETVAVPHFRSRARDFGRDPDALEVMAVVTCCLGDDQDLTRRRAREAFLARLRGDPEKRLATVPPRFWDEIRRLSALVQRGELERAIDETDDELVNQFIAAGSAPTIQASIQRYIAAGCTRIALASYPRDADSVRRLLHALRPSPTDH
jgi:alkanesulfonate monooxygenase SsuD/methylene tetrahydromethanopterin reductase-like flavin-dependent oxidoreductase (luciferase family)